MHTYSENLFVVYMKTKFKWAYDILSTRRSLFSRILGLLKKITTILNCTFYFFLILLPMYTYLNILLVFEFKKWLLPYKYSLLWLAFFTSHFVSRIYSCRVLLYFVPLYHHIIFHCVTVTQLSYWFSCSWTFVLFLIF